MGQNERGQRKARQFHRELEWIARTGDNFLVLEGKEFNKRIRDPHTNEVSPVHLCSIDKGSAGSAFWPVT